jgi:hypothetical protein
MCGPSAEPDPVPRNCLTHNQLLRMQKFIGYNSTGHDQDLDNWRKIGSGSSKTSVKNYLARMMPVSRTPTEVKLTCEISSHLPTGVPSGATVALPLLLLFTSDSWIQSTSQRSIPLARDVEINMMKSAGGSKFKQHWVTT